VTWREGSNTELCPRFTAVRVRRAHRDNRGTQMRPHEWPLIEWPEDEAIKVIAGKKPPFGGVTV